MAGAGPGSLLSDVCLPPASAAATSQQMSPTRNDFGERTCPRPGGRRRSVIQANLTPGAPSYVPKRSIRDHGKPHGPQWNSGAALPSAMLQTAPLKCREVKQLASGHAAARWRCWDSDPDGQARDHEDVLCLEGNSSGRRFRGPEPDGPGQGSKGGRAQRKGTQNAREEAEAGTDRGAEFGRPRAGVTPLFPSGHLVLLAQSFQPLDKLSGKAHSFLSHSGLHLIF